MTSGGSENGAGSLGAGQRGVISQANGGDLGSVWPALADSGWSALASRAPRFRGLGTSRWDREGLGEAALRAARERVAGLGALRKLPGMQAAEYRLTATAGDVWTRRERPQRPHAPLEAWGECTPGALPSFVAAVGQPCGLPIPLGRNFRSHSVWP